MLRAVVLFCCALPAVTQPLKFEVAAIRRNVSDIPYAGGSESAPPAPPPPPIVRPSPTGLTIQHATVQYCLTWAMGVKAWQVSAADWVRTNFYDITAKTGAPVDEEQIKRMLVELLKERFQFEMRRESKESKVLGLVVAPGGLKLTPADPAKRPARKIAAIPGGGLRIVAENTGLGFLEQILSAPMWAPVLDRTGLKGGFDFTFERPGLDSANPDGWLADIQSALRKQLGLTLAEQKALVEAFTIVGGKPDPIAN